MTSQGVTPNVGTPDSSANPWGGELQHFIYKFHEDANDLVEALESLLRSNQALLCLIHAALSRPDYLFIAWFWILTNHEFDDLLEDHGWELRTDCADDDWRHRFLCLLSHIRASLSLLDEAEQTANTYIAASAIDSHPGGVGGAFGISTVIQKIARGALLKFNIYMIAQLTFEFSMPAIVHCFSVENLDDLVWMERSEADAHAIHSLTIPWTDKQGSDDVEESGEESNSDVVIPHGPVTAADMYNSLREEEEESSHTPSSSPALDLTGTTPALGVSAGVFVAVPEEEESSHTPSLSPGLDVMDTTPAPGVFVAVPAAVPATAPAAVSAIVIPLFTDIPEASHHGDTSLPPPVIPAVDKSRTTPISGLNLDRGRGIIAQLRDIFADPDFHHPHSTINAELVNRDKPSRTSPDFCILNTVGRPMNPAMIGFQGLECARTKRLHSSLLHRVLPSRFQEGNFPPEGYQAFIDTASRYKNTYYTGLEDYSDTAASANSILALHHPLFSSQNDSVLARSLERARFWKSTQIKVRDGTGRLVFTGPKGFAPPMHEELLWVQAVYDMAPDLVNLENSGRVLAASKASDLVNHENVSKALAGEEQPPQMRPVAERHFPTNFETTVNLKLYDLPAVLRERYHVTGDDDDMRIVKQVSLGNSKEPSVMSVISTIAFVDDVRRHALAKSLKILNATLSPEEKAEHKMAWDRGEYDVVMETPSILRESVDGEVVVHPLSGLLYYTIFRSIGLEGDVDMKHPDGSKVDASVLNSTHPVIGIPGALNLSLPPNLTFNMVSLTYATGLLQYGGAQPVDPEDVRMGRLDLLPIFLWSDRRADAKMSPLITAANDLNQPDAGRRLKIIEDVLLAQPRPMDNDIAQPSVPVPGEGPQTPWTWMCVPQGWASILLGSSGTSEWLELTRLMSQLHQRAADPSQANTIAGSLLAKNAPSASPPCYLVLRNFLDLIPEHLLDINLRAQVSSDLPLDYM
ncbi:hypothetical protein DXG01_016791 [Tephrocybe rancida]|nr:hypothetical protein DXG01_016791 [Tephrocybe rancida]